MKKSPKTKGGKSVQAGFGVDAKQEQRLAFLGALAGGLAHEIRNPLSTLNVNLQLLQEEWADDPTPKGKKTYQKILILLRETRRMEETLDDFLKFAGRHVLQLEPTDINSLIDDILTFIREEIAQKNIRILKYYEPSLPELDLDGKLMKQALLNIMINARQAMPEGGELIVKTRLADTQVELEFTDTGLGMTPDVREKIFNVYYSTKKTGTGLGLPTARRIIEEHNGSISVQSEVGKGSCFIIRLPIKVAS